MKEKICILMSSYNGENYITQQLDSIFLQNDVEILLCIRDDGSTDNTVKIIKNRKEYQTRIILLEEANVGLTKSFYKLMRYAKQRITDIEYFAFSDQDDVWLPDKLKVAIKNLKKFDNQFPNLYYSNLKVVDNSLNYLYERFSKGYVKNTKQQIMAEICTLGCTCVFNKQALDEMCKLTDEELDYHDNWILWVCTFLGNSYYDENSYILYRQHGDNSSGTVKKGIKYIKFQISRLKKIKEMAPCYEEKAKLMLKYYSNELGEEDRNNMKMLTTYRYDFRVKLRLLFTNKIKSGHIVRDMGRKLRIVFNKA